MSLVNESGGHNVPIGAETHFRLVIVSDAFDGLATIKVHLIQCQLHSFYLDVFSLHSLCIVFFFPLHRDIVW